MAKNKNVPPHYVVTVDVSFAIKDHNGEKARKSATYDIPVPISVTADIPIKQFDPRTQKHFWHNETKTLRIEDYGILSYLIRERRIQNRIAKDGHTFVALLTHEITNIRSSSPDIPLPSNPYCLSKSQLEKFIRSNGWPIDISLFPSVKNLREAVMNFKESPESYEVFEQLVRRRNATGNAFTKVQDELEEIYQTQTPPNNEQNELDIEL